MKASILKAAFVLAIQMFFLSGSFGQYLQTSDGTAAFGQQQMKVEKTIAINGAEMYYEIFGQGEPLLLLHDAGQNMRSFQKQINGLSRNFRVISVDFRGLGNSKSGPQVLSYDLLAEDIGLFINELQLENVHLLGWGDGGIVALYLALQQKHSLGKVVIYSTALSADTAAYYPEIAGWYEEQSTLLWANPAKAFESQFMKMKLAGSGILLSDLKKIQLPVLVIAAEKGLIREKHNNLIRKNLNMGQIAVIPGGNYFSPETHGIIFNEMVSHFLQMPYQAAGRLPIKKDNSRQGGDQQGNQINRSNKRKNIEEK